MVNIDELEQMELEELNNETITDNTDDEIDLNELENLILEGTDYKVPVLIEYPVFNKKTGEMKNVRYTAKLRPVTNTEVNNARRSVGKIKGTSFELELLKRALYTKNDELFKPAIIFAMKAGVVARLVETLLDISGIKLDKDEQEAYARELMGF